MQSQGLDLNNWVVDLHSFVQDILVCVNFCLFRSINSSDILTFFIEIQMRLTPSCEIGPYLSINLLNQVIKYNNTRGTMTWHLINWRGSDDVTFY